MPRITFHEGEPAIEVKSHATHATFESYAPGFGRAYDAIGERVAEAIYESVREQFWTHDAPSIAAEFGYGEVYSDGHSGGWLKVSAAPELEEEPDPTCANCGHVILTSTDRGEERCERCGHVQPSRLARRRQRWCEFAGRIEALVNWSEREFARRVIEAAERERSKQTYLVTLVVPVRGTDPTEAWEEFTAEAERIGALFCGSPLRADANDIEDPDFDVSVRSHGRTLDYAEDN